MQFKEFAKNMNPQKAEELVKQKLQSGEMSQSQFEFLDIITIISFIMQLQNQSKLFSLRDIQNDNNRISAEIHKHLQEQDGKINKILEVLNNGKTR